VSGGVASAILVVVLGLLVLLLLSGMARMGLQEQAQALTNLWLWVFIGLSIGVLVWMLNSLRRPAASRARALKVRGKVPRRTLAYAVRRCRDVIPMANPLGAALVPAGLVMWAYVCVAEPTYLPWYWEQGAPGIYALMCGMVVGLGILVLFGRFRLGVLLLASLVAGGLGTAGYWSARWETRRYPVGLGTDDPHLPPKANQAGVVAMVNRGVVPALHAKAGMEQAAFQAAEDRDGLCVRVRPHADRRSVALVGCVSEFIKRLQLLQETQRFDVAEYRLGLAYRAVTGLQEDLAARFGPEAARRVIEGVEESLIDPVVVRACRGVLGPAARATPRASWREELVEFAKAVRDEALRPGDADPIAADLALSLKFAEQGLADPESPELLEWLLPLARLYAKQERHPLADAYYKRAIPMLEKSPRGRDRLRLATALADWGEDLRARGDEKTADRLQNRALALMEKISAPASWFQPVAVAADPDPEFEQPETDGQLAQPTPR
jgi:tetratricopeptide (TPR) repeat protein